MLRALLPLIPGAHYVYIGDTARLPYGSKSHETIARYAVSSAKFLHDQGAQLLVIACNTATALALPDIQQALPIHVIGVIEPGARAALQSTAPSAANKLKCHPERTLSDPERALRVEGESKGESKDLHFLLPPHVLVMATAATVQSHAYTRALNALGLTAHEKACPLLVPLVEEGWINHPVTDEVLKIYLTEALNASPESTTLLLGCTHYPLLEPAIRRTLDALNHPLHIIDSAESTAQATATLVAKHFPNLTTTAKPTCTFYATDSIEKFQRLGSNFLGQPVTTVSLVDLGG